MIRLVEMLKVRAIEQIVKSFGNHRRIEMLDLIDTNPELSVSEIAENLKIDIKLASIYLRRLTISNLIMKRGSGKTIRHKITKRGQHILTFVRTLE